MNQHTTVLLDETVSFCLGRTDGNYIDGTFGRGGHSRLLLSRLSPNGKLLGIDRDPSAKKTAAELQKEYNNFYFASGNFSEAAQLYRQAFNVTSAEGVVDGLMLDLGVSSPQLDNSHRGFSFMLDGPLDMRMNPEKGISAAEWLAEASVEEMAQVFWRFGEEKQSYRVANIIAERREVSPIETTGQLVEICDAAMRRNIKGKHNATRVFQAVRIFINNELSELESLLDGFFSLLAKNGRMAIISFHSLEDRLVKRKFKALSQSAVPPKGIPVVESSIEITAKIVGKAIKPTEEEIKANPRSRSAVLRVLEKTI